MSESIKGSCEKSSAESTEPTDFDPIDRALQTCKDLGSNPTDQNELSNLKETTRMLLLSLFEDESHDLHEDAIDLAAELEKKTPPENPTDVLLKIFEDVEPVSLVIPELRHLMGFGVHTDDMCVNALRQLKDEANGQYTEAFDRLIDFVNADEGVDVPHELNTMPLMADVFDGYKSKSLLLECHHYILELIDDGED